MLTRSLGFARGTAFTGLLFLIGCFGNEETVFPPGLEPLEESTAVPMAALPGDTYPEGLVLIRGETAEYHFVHGHGYVDAPLETVFEAASAAEACVDYRQTDRQTIVPDVEPDYERSFLIQYEVDEFITVGFEVTWRHGVVQGPHEAPEVTSGTFQKTFGTMFISLMRGSIVARRVDDATTEIEFVEHISAASGGSDDIYQVISDYYANIVALSHGEPLPMYVRE